MSITTSNMGLVAWDLGTDPYDHAQLANNFVAIDAHDHTSGKGKQIPAAGLADGAITSAKIQDGAIIPTKIPDASITQAKLANNSVGSAQIIDGSITSTDILDGTIAFGDLNASVVPIGQVIMWYRATPSVSIPSGWEVLDGRAWSSVTNKLGPGGTQWNTGNMPNFANKFPLGAALSGTGSGATQPPDIGQTGGAMTIDLSHTHTVNAHSHTVNAHSHSISTEPAHNHQFFSTLWDSNGNPVGSTRYDAHQRGTAVPGATGKRQSLYVPDLNKNEYYGEDVVAPMTSDGAHSHGGATATATATTSSDAASTATALGTTIDHRNAYVGLLFLIRVT